MTESDKDRSAGAAMAAAMVAARLDRLPLSSWHIRVRLILGIATFFDAVDLLAISFALPALAGPWHLSPQQIGAIISAGGVGILPRHFSLAPGFPPCWVRPSRRPRA